jgi:uncharacterized damage-inducible protein DinB
MTIAKSFLAEFDNEVPKTKQFLERVPADKLAWKPHEKSMTAGQLALHIATVPGGVVRLAAQDPAQAPDFNAPRPQPASIGEVLSALEQSSETVHATLPTFDDQRMQAIWRLVKDGKDLLVLPRMNFLRNIMLNHWYHHRGQLGVYLRLLGAKVPSSYGPSGDEVPDFFQDSKRQAR